MDYSLSQISIVHCETLPELYSGWRGEFAKELLLKRLSELDE